MIVRHTDGLVGFRIPDGSPLARHITLRDLKTEAADALAAYPQYEGYHDGPEWGLVRVARRVKTKLGVAFEKGDVVLGKRHPAEPRYDIDEGWTCWSRSNRIHTSLPLDYAEAVTA